MQMGEKGMCWNSMFGKYNALHMVFLGYAMSPQNMFVLGQLSWRTWCHNNEQQ